MYNSEHYKIKLKLNGSKLQSKSPTPVLIFSVEDRSKLFDEKSLPPQNLRI